MARSKDLAGKSFGRWTVLGRAGSDADGSVRWLCRCACGTERPVRGKRLASGETRSCGCASGAAASRQKIGDLAPGQRFGDWHVVRFDDVRSGRAYWLCRCACGRTRSVLGANLRKGRSKSCGHRM